MQPPIRELPHTDLPRASVYATGVTCGVFATMVVQILLSHAGIELSDVWRNLLSTQALQLRSAGAWWLMAGSAFLTSALVVAALSRLPLPWHRFRLIRWILGAAVVFALADIGHMASEVNPPSGGAHVAVRLAALLAAAPVSLFAAYFASKR
jgi:hypothetical protein